MKSMYDILYEIDNNFTEYGLHFDKIEGYSIVGEIRSNAYKNPVYYLAYVNSRPGDDDPYQGEGKTPYMAVKDLLKNLKQVFKEK